MGWPLDRIIHAEVWATDTIPADLPPMVEFKAKADEIIYELTGIRVEHLCATRNGEKLTYEKMFYHIPKRKPGGKFSEGSSAGFPYTKGAWCNDRLKTNPLDAVSANGGDNLRVPIHNRKLVQEAQRRVLSSATPSGGQWCTSDLKRRALSRASLLPRESDIAKSSRTEFSKSSLAQGAKINIVQYLGIAADEPERIARHTKPGFKLPLVEMGWDEAYCRKLCEEHGLLSPIYTTATRGGCWFCHNQGVDQLRLLRKQYPDLWSLLLKWDADSPTTFKADGHTVHDYDLRFQLEDEGRVPKDRTFRWKMLNIKEETNMANKKTDTPEQDYTGLNALQKLQMARVEFLKAGVKKSGKNIHMEFQYFELADIVPTAETIFGKLGLLMVPTFGKEYAIARVYNCDNREEEPIVFEAPFTQIAPIISNSGKVVTNEMQALGSSITYMRRYLWQLVLDVIEADAIDATAGAGADDDAPPAPAPKKNNKPVTAAKRNEIKKELTAAPDGAASDEQIATLKSSLKALMELDPEQESFVQDIAVKTEGFTKITAAVCDQLIAGVLEMREAYDVEG